MLTETNHPAPIIRVVFAFAIVYLVWGSTYFFIRLAIQHIPAMMMAFLRFFIAGLLLLISCALRGERLFVWKDVKPAMVAGLLLLGIGTGAIVWAEQYLPSSFVAVLAAASPIWVVLLDKKRWSINFRSRETVLGLIIGFIGVVILFSEKAIQALSTTGDRMQIISFFVVLVGSMGWAGGSLYSKYYSTGPSYTVNSSWQMLAAGAAFLPISYISGDWVHFHWQQVSLNSWLALAYLISFGSLAGFSAYIWLLRVRPATQVSTHSYVNPVVAVLLGTLLAGEKMTMLQITGLTIILTSVLLVNLAKYRKEKLKYVIPG